MELKFDNIRPAGDLDYFQTRKGKKGDRMRKVRSKFFGKNKEFTKKIFKDEVVRALDNKRRRI